MTSTDIAMYEESTRTPGTQGAGGVFGVLCLSLVFLGLAHLAVKDYFPNPVLWLIGATAVVAVGVGYLVVGKNHLSYLLVIFVCAHFSFADNQGGFWSYVMCAVFTGALMLGQRMNLRFFAVPLHVSFLLILLTTYQLLGLVTNGYSAVSNLQSAVVTASQLLAFYCCASQKFDEGGVRSLLRVWLALFCWITVMALNQKYHWVITSTPLLPQRFRPAGGHIAAIPAASFGNSELFGEYCTFIFTMALVLLSHGRELAALRIRRVFLFCIAVAAAAGAVMSGSRAAVILTVAAAVALPVGTFLLAPSFRTVSRGCIVVVALLLCCGIVWKAGSIIALDDMVADMEAIHPSKITTENIITGKGINRSFSGAYRRLESESWIIGKGFNLPENNTESLGLQKGASDYHSLYLCLPFFYGWGGAAAFVIFVLATWWRIVWRYLCSRKSLDPLVPVALALSLIWGIFLVDQYKISVTRNPSYFLIIWMLLGWTHAVANALRAAARQPAQGEAEAPMVEGDPSCVS